MFKTATFKGSDGKTSEGETGEGKNRDTREASKLATLIYKRKFVNSASSVVTLEIATMGIT